MIDTALKLKSKRSKSEAYNNDQSLHERKIKQQKKSKEFKISDHQGRRCHCCNQKHRYPDYLAELRKQRLQKIKRKSLAEVLMQTPIPLIQSKHIQGQIISEFMPQQQNFISKMSNKVSEYQQTPPKSILQSFHDSIIKSHSKKQGRSSLRNELYLNSRNRPEETQHYTSREFMFQIRVQNPEINEYYYRKFTAPQYGAMAIDVIEQIFSKFN